jgi:mevalonate kinase
MKGEIFYAKIMLFGEYSVIFDSMGLTVPYAHFTGELSFINFEQYTEYETAVESNRHLQRYLPFLLQVKREDPANLPLDLDSFENDIKEGLYFESNIPQGYGIGSSGALVAAIYDRYSGSKIKNRKILTGPEIAALKSVFSRMESFFHGRSSGLDPLLCYIRHPLLIRSKTGIETVGIPRDKFGANHAIFLIDTGKAGQTGPLVNLFLDNCKNDRYLSLVKEVLIPSNNGCILSLLEGDMGTFFTHLETLSAFQFEYLPDMIPEHMKKFWSEGLLRDDYKMKLCGSGGGGFILGISRNFRTTRKYFQQNGLDLVPVYKND